MSPKTGLEKPTTPATKTEHKFLEQPMLTAEEMAELRQSSQEAMAEFRAIWERKRKLALELSPIPFMVNGRWSTGQVFPDAE